MKQLLIHRAIIFVLAVTIIALWFRLSDQGAKDKSIGSLQDRGDDLARPEDPIKFDAELNEYHLVYSYTNADGGRALAHVIMDYDPFSGARLPQSKRASFFHEPDTTEEAAISARLRGATTITAVRGVLGAPDSAHGPRDRFKQQLTYSRLTKTIDIIVQESTNGEVSIIYAPNRQGTY